MASSLGRRRLSDLRNHSWSGSLLRYGAAPYFSHSFQDEKNLNLRYHTSQTVTRISVASGDTSSRLTTLQIEQQIQAEYTFLSIFPINLMRLLPSMDADVL